MKPFIIMFALAFAALFPVFLIALIVRRGRSAAWRNRFEERQIFENARTARARIVNARRAVVQRTAETVLYKFLLEVFPGDLQPAFSVAVVWEIAPAAIDNFQPGDFVRVKFDGTNLRKVFPDADGARYSHRYQHAYLGIEDDFRVEQEATTVAGGEIAPAAPKPNTIYRRRSETIVFGLPLWEVAFNLINKRGRMRYVRQAKARAIIAVGDSATGFIAVGAFARGFFAVGQLSCGVVSCGLLSVGLISCGIGAIGVSALGIISGGGVSIGALSGGFASVGLLTIARYAFSKDDKSPEMNWAYEVLKSLTGLNDSALEQFAVYAFIGFLAVSLFSFLFSFAAQVAAVRILEPNDNRLDSPC